MSKNSRHNPENRPSNHTVTWESDTGMLRQRIQYYPDTESALKAGRERSDMAGLFNIKVSQWQNSPVARWVLVAGFNIRYFDYVATVKRTNGTIFNLTMTADNSMKALDMFKAYVKGSDGLQSFSHFNRTDYA